MTFSAEVPGDEKELLRCFLEIRQHLTQLKQDRKQYLNSKNIYRIYQEVLTKVNELGRIRRVAREKKRAEVTARGEEYKEEIVLNRVDSVMDDVFQLLSLSFLTCGLKNTAPATYSSVSTVQRLLEHLEESKIYTYHDLRPIKQRLDEISKIVVGSNFLHFSVPVQEGVVDSQDILSGSNVSATSTTENSGNASGNNSGVLKTSSSSSSLHSLQSIKQNDVLEDTILKIKLKKCIDQYHVIENNLEKIDPELEPVMESLYSLRRELLSLTVSSRNNPTSDCLEQIPVKLERFNRDLIEIESHRDEMGNFISFQTSGQNVLNGLLDECHDLINDLRHTHYYSNSNQNYYNDKNLQKIYNTLVDTKSNLENLLITRRWTLRETDLYCYQKDLEDIDRLRTNGKFTNASNNLEDEQKSQSILLYLLRRCYAIIYKLLESSEPVSESLQRLHNQLSTVRRCLLELKRLGGVDNERELYPYQMKLASLDNLRVDGKFYDDDGNIPEGQGTLNALLSECFDILHELKIEAEDREKEIFSTREGTPLNPSISATSYASVNSPSARIISKTNSNNRTESSGGDFEVMNNNNKKFSSSNIANSKLGTNNTSDAGDNNSNSLLERVASDRNNSIQLTKDSTTRDISELENPNEEDEIARITKKLQKNKLLSSVGEAEEYDDDDALSNYSLEASLAACDDEGYEESETN